MNFSCTWQININNELALGGQVLCSTDIPGGPGRYFYPEGTIIFDCDSEITIQTLSRYTYFINIIGFLIDKEPEIPADLNTDGTVNMIDMSILASYWLQ